MKVIDFIFVSPSGMAHEIIGSVVRYATDSLYSHTAIRYDNDFIIESIAPKVCKQAFDKYEILPVEEIDHIRFYLNEDEYQNAVEVGEFYIGWWYGIDKCIVGGAHDVFGENISDWLADKCNGIKSINCSGLGTEIAKSFLYDLKINDDSDEITPEGLHKILLDYINGER